MQLRDRDFSNAPVVLDIRELVVELPNLGQEAPILKGISLDIRQGETVCLVGESGSGKSVTSLATMGLLPKGVLRVRCGTIRLEGMNLLEFSQAQMRDVRTRRVSMIFQEPMTALNPVMPVGDQIMEVLDLHTSMNSSQKRAKVIDIMEQVHLPDVERIFRSFPHQLSGGQRQRIMIAMALILEPALLIADEPTTALDVTTQRQILSLIAELQEKHGTAVLFITHDMGVVAEIADRVCVMRQGEIMEHGTIVEVLANSQNDYTKNLLASVPSLAPRSPRHNISAPSIVSVQGLGMIYSTGGLFSRKPDVKAAHDVSFELKPGRTLGIVGESGSGRQRLPAPSCG